MSTIGDNIRALRKREGITQQELADALHVSRETVNKWESGTIEALRENNARTLRQLFGLSVDDLTSEASGLAAQRKQTQRRRAELGRHGAQGNLVPLSPEVVWQGHPNAYAIEMDSSMSKVLPAGSHALVDPSLEPHSGSIVLAEVKDGETRRLVVRRLYQGSSKVMLSAESYEPIEDLVLDAEDIEVRGTVFWYQPARELS